MTSVFNPEMVKFALECGKECGFDLKQGAYAYYNLPSFESPTDVQILRHIGVTTVGASTVPEHTAAGALKMNNICISLVTNMGCGLSD
jgi:purine-nucleoside phosphorylase